MSRKRWDGAAIPPMFEDLSSGVYVYGEPIETCPTEKLKDALTVFTRFRADTWRQSDWSAEIAIVSHELSRRAVPA